MYEAHDLAIKEATYDLCVRAFSMIEKRLGLAIRFHHDEGQADAGQIFLFNHFARFETIVPQYLIHKETGAYCRCVAAKELFAGSPGAAKFLYGVGAVPNDLPGLLPFLAAEILRGRKVVVFPEGGMVKDRRVLDKEGGYGVFSPTALTRRKHHKGAAVIALTLEAFKARILSVLEAGEHDRLRRWVDALGLDDIDGLIAAARKPTIIVPANITFYPIRTTDNLLSKGVELFSRGVHPQLAEELLIEGNILLKDTDMDVRFGDPITPTTNWRWWERLIMGRVFNGVESLEDLFGLVGESGHWIERLVSMGMVREIRRERDAYMHAIYTGLTVNLGHLAASLICSYLESGVTEVDCGRFHKALYLAIKNVQRAPEVHLHPDLMDPNVYGDVLTGESSALEEFFTTAIDAQLVERLPTRYRFLEKIGEKHEFDQIRLENQIAVLANEMAPVVEAGNGVARAVRDVASIDDREMARLLFDDEVVLHEHCRALYSQPRHEEINSQETATESGAPFLLLPDNPNGMGVVLAHGFLASPAELRGLGDKLSALGYTVLGVRLAGHGSSPWDLRDRDWKDWLASVTRGYDILSRFIERICVVGFSTGGNLVLLLAAERPDRLAGAVAISAPLIFRNRNLMFVPIIHGANKLARWVPKVDGVMPFRLNESEHPDINYRHIPIRGLYELRRTVSALKRRLSAVACPVLLVQGTEDQVVDPKSVDEIFDSLGPIDKSVHMVEARRHGIVTENTGDTHEAVISFLESVRAGHRPAAEARDASADRQIGSTAA